MSFLKTFFKKRVLGIDIGTDAIKVVEISIWGNRKKLENYGEVKSHLVSKEPLLSTNKEGNLVVSSLISKAIIEILEEAKIKTKKVILSLPDFLTFSTSFEVPSMPGKEIQGAIYYNASRYLTLPVSEVTLDWRTISNNSKVKNNSPIEVFLNAAPNQVIKEYQEISRAAGLELYALESEVFGIMRALVKDKENVVCLIDMGAKTSTINIIDEGHIKKSYSFNFSGDQLSLDLSSALNIQLEEARKIKSQEGLLSTKENVVNKLKSSIDPLFSEIKNISADFLSQNQKQIKEFYLTGGTANLLGFKNYFAESFKKPVYIPNCFLGFSQPRVIKENLEEMSPRFSAALGVALGISEI